MALVAILSFECCWRCVSLWFEGSLALSFSAVSAEIAVMNLKFTRTNFAFPLVKADISFFAVLHCSFFVLYWSYWWVTNWLFFFQMLRFIRCFLLQISTIFYLVTGSFDHCLLDLTAFLLQIAAEIHRISMMNLLSKAIYGDIAASYAHRLIF